MSRDSCKIETLLDVLILDWQLTLVILSIKGQRDELYGNHMLEVLEYFLATFDLSGYQVSLLDGDFDWYKKYFRATNLVFKLIGSLT